MSNGPVAVSIIIKQTNPITLWVSGVKTAKKLPLDIGLIEAIATLELDSYPAVASLPADVCICDELTRDKPYGGGL